MLLLMPGCEHLTGQGTRTGRKGSECIQGGERISGAGSAYQERTRLHITVLKIRMRTEVASHTRTGNAYHIGHVYWAWNYAGVVSVRFIVSFFKIGDPLKCVEKHTHLHPGTKRIPSHCAQHVLDACMSRYTTGCTKPPKEEQILNL